MPELIIYILAGCVFVILLLFMRVSPGKTYESELTWDGIRDYFFKKHDCKDCNARLKRIAKDEFLGEGWSTGVGGFSYREKYKRTYFLKCPNCFRMYTSDDY